MNTLNICKTISVRSSSTLGALDWRMRILGVLLGTLLITGSAATSGAPNDERAVRSAYAQIEDIRIYFETRGAGEPIFMLHGAFGTSANWALCADILAKHFLVITTDARGRGRTGDGDGPISPGRTAHDLVGLMNHLGIAKAHLVGHSAGSLTAVHMLIDFPDRVRSATLVGSPLVALASPNAGLQQLRRNMVALGQGQPDDDELKQFAEQWRRLAPDPSRFPVAMEKFARRVDTSYPEAALASISSPVLVMKAGRDRLIQPEAFDRLAAAIKGSKSINFPEGTHGLPRQESARLAEEIQKFIDSLESSGK